VRKTIKIIAKGIPSFYIDIPALRPGTVGAYALAVVSVGAATALRVALDPYLDGAQFVTFFPAIAITTLISGFGAGFFLRRAQYSVGRFLRAIAALFVLP
jgi:hypothetical protein